ncbi:MAG TPA: anti-sigma factor [Candidatus Eremiobacteraceae bacterium]|nr:anti-sigma factor [Candidatus Eremiobacteraceae bacterium]
MSTQHDDAMLDLVAAYAVGAIDSTTGESEDVRKHLTECAICREEFKVVRAATAALALSAAEAPPPDLRERIMTSLPSKVVPLSRRSRSPWFVPTVAAAVVLIAAGVWWSGHRAPPSTWAVACVPAASGCHASGTVTVAVADHLHMQLSGLAPLPAGKQYQAWVIPPGSAPKPEPVFAPDEGGAGSIDIPEPPIKGALVAVTVEPAGGSQQPTSKPFLVAKLD